jgi:hypothetical protein
MMSDVRHEQSVLSGLEYHFPENLPSFSFFGYTRRDMPPTVQDLQHYKQVIDAYKAKLRSIVGAHKKRVRTAMNEVDVRKANAIKQQLIQKKSS